MSIHKHIYSFLLSDSVFLILMYNIFIEKNNPATCIILLLTMKYFYANIILLEARF